MDEYDVLASAGGKLLVVLRVDEDDVVDKGSDSSTNKWSKPVDPVVVPGPADDSGTKGNCWVHGCTIKGTTS